jgi:beta-glucosidase
MHRNFLWGVATSAFQIEGSIENDFTEWEVQGKFQQNGEDPRYENGTDHWLNWEKDFELLKKLNVNAYRFSIEWARIEPESGKFDNAALDQYVEMINHLIEIGIEPVLTLHHFSHPKWFHKESPWHKSESIIRFINFVEYILPHIIDKVKIFVSINEPMVWALAAYADAKFPPGEKNFNLMMQAVYNLLIAHKQVYDLIKCKNENVMVGIAKNFIVFRPARKWLGLDQAVTSIAHNFFNLMLLEAFKTNKLSFKLPLIVNFHKELILDNSIDFWGVNYYYRMFTRFNINLKAPLKLEFKQRSSEGKSGLGWENYSKGLRKVIKMAATYGKPIYITENGIATDDDMQRLGYLKRHLHQVELCKKQNIDLRGYFYWSFLDNYEWLLGKNARFGLVHVSYDSNFLRTIKQSGMYYANHIKEQLKSFNTKEFS